MKAWRRLLRLFAKAGRAWLDDDAASMGAISYYTVFSLAPLLVIVVALAGSMFGREAVQGRLSAQLSGLVGPEGAGLLEKLVAAASDTDRGLVAALVGLALLLAGATSVFAELQGALDRIWHVPASQRPAGLRAIVRARLLPFGLILGLALLLMASFVASAALALVGSSAAGLLPGSRMVLYAANAGLSLGVFTLLFAMIFKLLPSASIAWHDVWVGAFVTALLFEAGKLLIGLYIGASGVGESFAAAGSLVVVLAWVYYAAQIFLLGAEFTKVYAEENGSRRARAAMQATRSAAARARASGS
ncbi:MAG TPA: YihY/virulence factor BrkB family protein [Ramlibacter sp.]|nr:YihY/virulence factor BrkB family protein [Ramlibacter sp.]